jgi:hypothetical protein
MKKTGDVEEMKAVMTVAKYIIPSNSALLASSSASKSVDQQAVKSR